VSKSKTEQEFEVAMFEIYRRAKAEVGYNAKIFYNMLHRNGGLQTAKTLINSNRLSDGYGALMKEKRLDLTVEAMVVEQQKWHPLFLPEEIEKAKKRLQQTHYVIKLVDAEDDGKECDK